MTQADTGTGRARASSMGEDGIWRLAIALSGAVTTQEVAIALAEEGAAAAGASFANMAMLDPLTRRVRLIHQPGLPDDVASRWSEFDLSTPTPLCEAMLTSVPVLLASIDTIGLRYPNLAHDTVAAGLAATASLPLSSPGGQILGAAGFAWSEPQLFATDQIRRLDLIARLSSQSLDRALLYERERAVDTAREQAEAHLIQEAFLPVDLPDAEHLDMAAVYLPASDAALGGDWYDAFSVDGGMCMVIGDVAGHGLRSAAVMAQLRNAVRAYAMEDPSPGSIMTRLNRMLCHFEPDTTASAIIAIWNPVDRTFLRTNAGHPPALRCRTGEFSYLTPPTSGLLLGTDPTWEYTDEPKTMRPGTTLLFYTDGVTETRQHGVTEGMAELKSFVEGLADLSPRAVCDAVTEWRLGNGRREDDMCLLAVRLA